MSPQFCNIFIPQYLCTLETCCISVQGWLDYLPTVAGNSVYLAIFAVLIFIHLYLGIRYKTWGYLIGTVCCGILEVAGYAGRLLLHQNIFNENYFILYLVCLTIAPAFLAAAIYLFLSRIIRVYGAQQSRFRPATYSIVFISFDFVSLVLQATGGAISATSDTTSAVDAGIDIMITGLSFQVFSLSAFMVACLDVALRLRKDKTGRPEQFAALRATTKFKFCLWALGLATVTILIRCIFRVAELQGGFHSAIANSEVAFMILEGPMIIIAMTVMALFHPGFCFDGQFSAANFYFGKKKDRRQVYETGQEQTQIKH